MSLNAFIILYWRWQLLPNYINKKMINIRELNLACKGEKI